MSLQVIVRSVTNLPEGGTKQIKARFRDSVQTVKAKTNAKDRSLSLNETFDWPLGSGLVERDVVSVQVLNLSKYSKATLIGSIDLSVFVLTETPTDTTGDGGDDGGGKGKLDLEDFLLSPRGQLTKVSVSLLATYILPEHMKGFGEKDSRPGSIVGGPTGSGSRAGSMRLSSHAIVNMDHGGRPGGSGDHWDSASGYGDDGGNYNQDFIIAMNNAPHTAGETSSLVSTSSSMAPWYVDDAALPKQDYSKYGSAHQPTLTLDLLESEDFEVSISIVKAEQLAGMDINPVCYVQVGQQIKMSSVQQATNCPYWDQYFVFDMKVPKEVLLDQIVKIWVEHRGGLAARLLDKIFHEAIIGLFVIDLATVYKQPNHIFFHKWAPLNDPKDFGGPVKGFVQLDIAVVGKTKSSSSSKLPSVKVAEDDSIASNLVVPVGYPSERFRRPLIINIFKARLVSRLDMEVHEYLKQKITGNINNDLIDPYVRIEFGGKFGKTRAIDSTCQPEWNDQIVFYDLFPAFCQRIKIQLMDKDAVGLADDVIATQFVRIEQICNYNETTGFAPTFGPTWIYFYGTAKSFSLRNKGSSPNEGIGEGDTYKGKLLLSIEMPADEDDSAADNTGPWEVHANHKVNENISETMLGNKKEFILFCALYDASIINYQYTNSSVSFHISIGLPPEDDTDEGDDEAGDEDSDSDSDTKSLQEFATEHTKGASEIKVAQSVPTQGLDSYCYLPITNRKKCLYVKKTLRDQSNRDYHRNCLLKLAKMLKALHDEITEKIKRKERRLLKRLKEKLRYVAAFISKIIDTIRPFAPAAEDEEAVDLTSTGAIPGVNELDSKRAKQRIDILNEISQSVESVIEGVSYQTMRKKLATVLDYVNLLTEAAEEPQGSFADVVIWMLVDDKRVAYARVPSHEIIHSVKDIERGEQCGKEQTLFLKLPAFKMSGKQAWRLQCKLSIALYLGSAQNWERYAFRSLRKGCIETPREVKQRVDNNQEAFLTYSEEHKFDLEAFLFQARNIIGSDTSGLSDPFVEVVSNQTVVRSEIIHETLNPVWNQKLVLPQFTYYGDLESLLADPPILVADVYDFDTIAIGEGSAEFLGRSLTTPTISLNPDGDIPRLQWWTVKRGTLVAGELLAAFRLVPFQDGLQQRGHEDNTVGVPIAGLAANGRELNKLEHIPRSIRPRNAVYRLEVLFWGLRELKRLELSKVQHPVVEFECAGHTILRNASIADATTHPNFSQHVFVTRLRLPVPEQFSIFCPPLSIKCYDQRTFGRKVLVGTNVIVNPVEFLSELPTSTQFEHMPQLLDELFDPVSNRLKSSLDGVEQSETALAGLDSLAVGDTASKVMEATASTGTGHGSSSHSHGAGGSGGAAPGPVEGYRSGQYSQNSSNNNNQEGSTHHDGGPTGTGIGGGGVGTVSTTASTDPLLHHQQNQHHLPHLPPPTASHNNHIGTNHLSSHSHGGHSNITSRRSGGSSHTGGVTNRSFEGDIRPAARSPHHSGAGSLSPHHPHHLQQQAGLGSPGGSSPHRPGTALDKYAEAGMKSPSASGGLPPKPKLPGGEAQVQAVADAPSPLLDWWDRYYASMDDFIEILAKLCSVDPAMKEDILEAPQSRTELMEYIRTGMEILGDDEVKYLRTFMQQKNIGGTEDGSDDDESNGGAGGTAGASVQLLKSEQAEQNGGSPSPPIKKDEKPSADKHSKFKVFAMELEEIDPFEHFEDRWRTYAFYRGKKSDDPQDDDRDRISGLLKAAIRLYRHPEDEGQFDEGGDSLSVSSAVTTDATYDKLNQGQLSPVFFKWVPPSDPKKILIRVYIVKALDLHPQDSSGKADPYLLLKLGDKTVNCKKEYVPLQLNPEFGKMFEFESKFPMGTFLTVQVMDWDMLSADDLIGETVIDLEDRLYSNRRATIGLSKTYEQYGYSQWRDPQKPTVILHQLCRLEGIKSPKYPPFTDRSLKKLVEMEFQGKVYTASGFIRQESGKIDKTNENLALTILHDWKNICSYSLVPEHVETRSLYHPEKPGILQGKLQMWVELTPLDLLSPGPTVDITPRKPKKYELRVTIWNTEDIPMDDTNPITGEATSDIYVKGWMDGMKDEEEQETDVHYRSLSGEGNFNWRFVFHFDYLDAEKKIVVRRKASVFDLDESEFKLPPVLKLSVWDDDLISGDDYIGELSLNLNQMIYGCKSAKEVKGRWKDLILGDDTPKIDLFSRPVPLRMWWPFTVKVKYKPEPEEETNCCPWCCPMCIRRKRKCSDLPCCVLKNKLEDLADSDDDSDKEDDLEDLWEMRGMVEAQIHLLLLEDAESKPVGKGREEPEPLAAPNRPDTSFLWFMSPLKTLRYIIWNGFKYKILAAFLILLLFAFIAVAIYTAPEATVQKMFGL